MTTETLTIKVLNIEENPTSTGKRRWSVQTDKGYMSIWDRELAEDMMKVGQATYEAKVSTKNNYKSILDVFRIPDGQNITPLTKDDKSEFLQSSSDRRETSIIAQVAFKGAVELCIAGKITLEELEAQAKKNLAIIKEISK